jgi:ABC-type multidrug transport system fused ATPase/permease subunit
MVQITPYLRPYWLRCVGIVTLTLLQVTFYLLLPVVFRWLFDLAVEGRQNTAALWRILSILAVGYVMVSVAELMQSFWSAALGAEVINDIRLRLLHHLQALPYGFYTHTSYGTISTRFTTDLAAADLALTTSVYKLCFHSLLILSSVVLLFVFEWRLALIALLTIPLGVIGPKMFGPYATHAGGARQEAEAEAISTVEENIRAQSTIRAFGLQAFSIGVFGRNLLALYQASLRTHVLFITEHYAPHQVVMRQNEPGDRFFLIVRGCVEVVRAAYDGQENRLQLLDDGDHFGEIALLRNIPRTATIRTLTPCTFLSLRQEHLLNLVAQSPRPGQVLEQSLKQRTQES